MGGNRNTGASVGLPPKPFLYSLDQVAMLLDVSLAHLRTNYIYFDGRSIGLARDRITARNIAPEGQAPEWRVAEAELVRWFKRKGFRFYDRGWLQS